ncbi:MAG: pyridoxamine 5'-phosphate oxidase family protein [Alphaproteobacteria bacterium]|nr:pyridoxamine 5'-phosphate oxidase family protein [Alphaproteobacteria bacterium]
MTYTTNIDLRSLCGPPSGRAARKEIHQIDDICRRYIALSPFVVMSTCDRAFNLDASPRGGAPGFVRVTDSGDLLLPDSPGNNRLDSIQNIAETGRIGLLFMVPGVKEILRVNGQARLSVDPEHLQACTDDRRVPKLVVHIGVESAYMHCAKALMRSQLWDASSHVLRELLPTMSEMIQAHSGMNLAPESQADIERRYQPDL